ncbi:MAG TPA: hypothetical protein VNZ45_07050 [Bacteroidia bacterium]|jgi:hypothetical protein|nr:hypothetical protein [Bacteroidia bacterium]
MINTDRSWIWLALVVVALLAWRFYFRPMLDKHNREKDNEENENHNEAEE